MINSKPYSQSEPETDEVTSPEILQRELNRLEEIILQSSRIPMSRWTIVDEEKLLNQLDLIRINWPNAFERALEVIQQRQEIIRQAEDYAREVVETAQRQAAQILDELQIVRQAELEAEQIRQQVRQECNAIQQQTVAELEQMQIRANQEIEQLRQTTLAECNEIQTGADEYADSVLDRIEQQLKDMLRIIRNGRQQLNINAPVENPAVKKSADNSSGRSKAS